MSIGCLEPQLKLSFLGGNRGFTLVRIEAYWVEWASEQIRNPRGEAEMDFNRTILPRLAQSGALAEWHGAGTSVSPDAYRFDFNTLYVHLRHAQRIRLLSQYRELEPYQGVCIILLG